MSQSWLAAIVALVSLLQTRALRGPIFEDGPGFENAFRLFHGRDGVVPLSEKQTPEMQQPQSPANDAASVETNLGFHPLSASSAATISLSSFGAFGPFSFDGFMARQNSKKPTKSSKRKSKKEDPEFEKDTQKSESNSKNVSFLLLLLPETPGSCTQSSNLKCFFSSDEISEFMNNFFFLCDCHNPAFNL